MADLSRDERLAWLRGHAAGDEGYDVPAPDGVTAACLRMLASCGGWYYDPVLDPVVVLAVVEAVLG